MGTVDIPRPRQHLIEASKQYPNAWSAFDVTRSNRGKDLPVWPEWCFAPMAVSYAVVSGGGDRRVSILTVGDVGRISALAAWRPTQGIYRFDSTLFSALIDTSINGDLPSDVLHRLPEWCVYVETPGLEWVNSPLYGFFAHLEWDVKTGREELRLLLDSENALTPIPVHIGQWPLSEAISRALDISRLNAASLFIPNFEDSKSCISDTVGPLVSLLLYLCADDAEIGDGAKRPSKPSPKRTKQGLRLFPAEKTVQWDVGVRIGAALRHSYQNIETHQNNGIDGTERIRPRAHIRRAHWHTFLSGIGRSDRKLKWLPPIPVNVEDVDLMPSTIRLIK